MPISETQNRLDKSDDKIFQFVNDIAYQQNSVNYFTL
jgi:hypothetical protein